MSSMKMLKVTSSSKIAPISHVKGSTSDFLGQGDSVGYLLKVDARGTPAGSAFFRGASYRRGNFFVVRGEFVS